MQADQSEAESKFWETPELLETLFLLLDLESTLSLAGLMDQENLQHSMTSKVWSRLVRQNCPSVESGLALGGYVVERDRLQEEMHVAKKLATILKLMKEPKDFLVDLLDVICERVPSTAHLNQLQMVCPRHPDPHSISPAGFLLLEEVEGFLGTTEQRIESIEVTSLSEQALSAIVSRMFRQQEAVTSIRIDHSIKIESEKGAQAIYNLMSSQVEPVIGVQVMGSIGEGGWEALGKATQLQPGVVGRIMTSKASLAEARKEDVKKVWEAVSPEGLWGFDIFSSEKVHRGPRYMVSVEKPGDDWGRLEQILDMSLAEFAVESRAGPGGESEVESLDESEEESVEESEEDSEDESEGEYIPEESEHEDSEEEERDDEGAGEEEDD